MKIVSLVYDLIRGGTEGQCARVAMAHARLGMDHQVAVMRPKGYFYDQVATQCGPIVQFDIQKMVSFDTVKKIKRFSEYLQDEQVDLLHGWDMDAAIFGYPAARRAGIPFLTSRRNMGDMLPPHKAYMLKHIDRASAGVVVNAQAIRKRIASYGCPESKIHVIPNILNLDEFEQNAAASETADGGIIGMVCRLEPEKDVDCFVRAASLLIESHPQVKFEIVGDGSERERLESYARDVGLADRLQWLGHRENVPEILSRWRIGTLVPSKNEGLSNAILEYFASGLPCVATDNGGNRELIEASGAGEVIPLGDAEKLAEVWASWIANNEATSALGDCARAYVERVHNCDTVAQQFANVYESLVVNG